MADLNALAVNWQGSVALWSGGDFNTDGTIDALDLNALGRQWQQSNLVFATIPEPAASPWFLAGVALFGGMDARRAGITRERRAG